VLQSSVPQREYFQQQRALALQQAQNDVLDTQGWLRIAAEWQKLIDALPADLGPDKPETHLLD
jgi:hypothetical protein